MMAELIAPPAPAAPGGASHRQSRAFFLIVFRDGTPRPLFRVGRIPEGETWEREARRDDLAPRVDTAPGPL